MSDESYPFGEVGKLLQTFLENRVEAMQTEGLKIDARQWNAAWAVARQLRGLITTFWAHHGHERGVKACLETDTLRFVEQYTQALPDNSPDVFHLVRVAREHVFAELVILEVMPQLNSRVRWLASKTVDWNLTEGSKSLHYLQMVSSSYLFGMDETCLVMCRASLEAWLEANVSNDECIGLGEKADNVDQGVPCFGLSTRLRVALKVQILDRSLQNSAEYVRNAGNKAVHQGARAGRKESERCIQHLMLVINSIRPSTAK